MNRHADLTRFYHLLRRLEQKLGGKRLLAKCNGRLNWPERGVYFFFESGELCEDTERGSRVVRVGTHALTAQSKTTLWRRLSQHKGVEASGGGNHRGSIFRLLVGSAIRNRDSMTEIQTWGIGQDAGKAAQALGIESGQVKSMEQPLEMAVSRCIRAMPFLWLAINDRPGPESHRVRIERNSIGLLSNFGRTPIDPPSSNWLGQFCDRQRVRQSGLWNNNHVNEGYDANFLEPLAELIG